MFSLHTQVDRTQTVLAGRPRITTEEIVSRMLRNLQGRIPSWPVRTLLW